MATSEKGKILQDISNQEKKELNTLFKNKNVSVCDETAEQQYNDYLLDIK